jgi:UDP-N-acetylenolpyruvoylglucosamine reductase
MRQFSHDRGEQRAPAGTQQFWHRGQARALVRIASVDDVHAVLANPALRAEPKFVLGGGSNIVLTGDVRRWCSRSTLRGAAWWKKRQKHGLWKPVRAKTGTISSPGRWTKATPAWRTWP